MTSARSVASRSSNRLHYFTDLPIDTEIPFVVPYWLVDGFAGAGPAAIPDLLESLESETPRKSDDYFMLLAASLIYQFTGFGFIDSLGALGLIYFSINEGKESFEKAERLQDDCCDDGD